MAPLPFPTYSDQIWVSNSKANRICGKRKDFETAELKGKRVVVSDFCPSECDSICNLSKNIHPLSTSGCLPEKRGQNTSSCLSREVMGLISDTRESAHILL